MKHLPFQTHDVETDENEIVIRESKPTEHEPSETETILENLQGSEDSAFMAPGRTNKALRVFGTILLSLALLAIGYWLGSSSILKPKQMTNAPITNTPIEYHESNETVTEQTFTGIPISVVIDNGPNSAPQRGLEKASIIWQALAEGDITRYLAVFTNDIPEIIGPVRSARTYFNSIANQYGGLYLHVGGNDLALEEIKKGSFTFTDVNEFFNGATFYRDAKRSAPHNVFTTRQQIEQFIKSKNVPTSTVALFPTSDPIPEGAATTSITIPYYPTLTDTIEWNGTQWIKKQNGVIWKDETGKPLAFDSIVLISIQDETGFHKTIPELRRYLFDLDGEALIMRDNVSISGTWKLSNNAVAIVDSNHTPLGVKSGKTLSILIPKTTYARVTSSRP